MPDIDMTTESTIHDIESSLRGVLDPELGVDIVELGMVRGIQVNGTAATIQIALTIAACPLRDQIEGDVVRKVTALPSIDSVDVQVTAMTSQQRSDLMGIARRNARDQAAPTMVSPMTRVIAVGSGKGGVGKSSLSVNLAAVIADTGFRVGLLDADIWGFSVPRMLGVTEARLEAGDDRKIIPLEAGGIQLVSTGLMIDDEQTALMWRGLMLSKALEQFLRDVAWDQELDYLVIDMPPGTGDIQMALARLLPQAEMVVVTTPQKAAQKVAARVADMARRSFLPVVGVVENMSGFTADDGTHYDLFGKGGGKELADELGVPLIGHIPLDPFVVEGGDDGAPVVRAHPDAPSARAIAGAAARILELVPPAADETCTARIAVLMEQLEQNPAS
ncbi:MAG: Mrp/NBP35 family ATP-binding protein [Acidimicrobiia bacterium]|nr:Mrp/NBP35 family ATP-binding protein [Acidimicrobiia bacterium]